MSCDIHIVVPEAMSVDDACALVREAAAAGSAVARPMRSSNHWVVEFHAPAGIPTSADCFLNSMAADDYQELALHQSTLIALPYSPSNLSVAATMAAKVNGWYRSEGADMWIKPTP